MSYAGLATRGYGSDSTIALVVRDGFPQPPQLSATLTTFGYGQVGSGISVLVRQFYSLATLVPYPPPAGKQYVDVAGLPWPAGAFSILDGASPPVENGDIIICDLVTTPGGYPVTMNGDGTFQIATASSTSREIIYADVFDRSLLSYYGGYTNWVNNHIPQSVGLSSAFLQIGVPFSLDLVNYVSDFENDPLVYAVQSGPLPLGLNLSGSLISGIPLSVAGKDVTFRITDATGDYFDLGPIPFTVATSIDNALQDLLDPQDNETGILITASANSLPNTVSYYCQPVIIYPGRARWVDVQASWTPTEKAAYIISVLREPI
jgi:hypothetical protein